MDSLTTPPTSIDLLKEQCNRYVNGQCALRKCLVRGGYVGPPVNYDAATCEFHDAVKAIQALQTIDAYARPYRDDGSSALDCIARVAQTAIEAMK